MHRASNQVVGGSNPSGRANKSTTYLDSESGDCPIFGVVSNILVPDVFLVSHSLALCVVPEWTRLPANFLKPRFAENYRNGVALGIFRRYTDLVVCELA